MRVHSPSATARFGCLALVIATAALSGCGGVLSADAWAPNATDRALTAEEAFVSERLANASCLESWGTDPTVVDREATVADRTRDGVEVNVTQPYWYATERDEADDASRARFVVTRNDTERLDGDDVTPC